MAIGLVEICDGWYFGKNGLRLDRVSVALSAISSGWMLLSLLALLFLSFPGNTIILPLLFVAWGIGTTLWIWPRGTQDTITIADIPIPREYPTYQAGFGIMYSVASYWAYGTLVD